ncbi:hypothetical protein CYMTET_14245 [Cymbomonas tetramitiformis]|uniref:CW-type domain-containing protein n=1 Tax=Cymbomonas tetramitiformis TaxID=36881 RepID=A0AAE0GGY7_9CHLO|nr:hypothetical protein CYMTET_14245 [Cymbomonas tetramitiformis]
MGDEIMETTETVAPRSHKNIDAESDDEDFPIQLTSEPRKFSRLRRVGVTRLDTGEPLTEKSAEKITPAEAEENEKSDDDLESGKESDKSEEAEANDEAQEPKFVWVQCEKEGCGKWRKLPHAISAESLEDPWECSFNTWNLSDANCEAPQEPGWDDDGNDGDEDDEEEDEDLQIPDEGAEYTDEEEEIFNAIQNVKSDDEDEDANEHSGDENAGTEEGNELPLRGKATKMNKKEKIKKKTEAQLRREREEVEKDQQRLLRECAARARFQTALPPRKPLTGVLGKINALKSKLAPPSAKKPEATPPLPIGVSSLTAGANDEDEIILLEDGDGTGAAEEPPVGKASVTTCCRVGNDARKPPPVLDEIQVEYTEANEKDGSLEAKGAECTRSDAEVELRKGSGLSLRLDDESQSQMEHEAPPSEEGVFDEKDEGAEHEDGVNGRVHADAEADDGSDADEEGDAPGEEEESSDEESEEEEEDEEDGDMASDDEQEEGSRPQVAKDSNGMRNKLRGMVEEEAEMSGDEGHSSEDDDVDRELIRDFIVRGNGGTQNDEELAQLHQWKEEEQDKKDMQAVMQGMRKGWKKRRARAQSGALLGSDSDLDDEERMRQRQYRRLLEEHNECYGTGEEGGTQPVLQEGDMSDDDALDAEGIQRRERYLRNKILEESNHGASFQMAGEDEKNQTMLGLIRRSSSRTLPLPDDVQKKKSKNVHSHEPRHAELQRGTSFLGRSLPTAIAGASSSAGAPSSGGGHVRSFVFGQDHSNSQWGLDEKSQQGGGESFKPGEAPAVAASRVNAPSAAGGTTLSNGFAKAGIRPALNRSTSGLMGVLKAGGSSGSIEKDTDMDNGAGRGMLAAVSNIRRTASFRNR